MLKPERVTFSVDDEQFHQYTTSDQLETFLNGSLVHYSTDFKKTDPQQPTSIPHSNSLDELSSITMSNQDQQTKHEPSASAPPSIISEQVPVLNENNLHQFDALTLQQLAVGSNQTHSNIIDENTKTSPSHSTSLADIQKEIDRVKQMKYNRTYSSPTSASSYRPRLATNPFNGPNNNVDLSVLTHSVHFNEQENPTNRLPFTSTFITSIPESIVPASGSSSTTNDNHFIPIHHIESPSLEDREVFETFHTKQTSAPGVAIRQQSMDSISNNISTPEKDLLASLHRSASKQALDSQSDHGTAYSGVSDDMIFVEWDKERNLFQDYINSLRTEIRVLLQERSEYQKQMEAINNNLTEHRDLNITQTNTDQTKYDLLQKSLEEKNLVLEQLQREYESTKEKNTNLTRKVSNLRCDAKSQTGVIDELKQKIAELTVDIQNHVVVKRRLEISMLNLESDCKLIDAERLRLNNDIKDTQSSKQELEKLLQLANVQIAEQGTTIEMLRSDNIQIRSQLSTTQRRMLQEKQQVMDYLRRIENDLVEKEQIKQRESILRKDYEKLQLIHEKDRQDIDQLNLQINHDKLKLNQLEQERLQLFKTIQNFDDKQTQLESDLDSYKSATKRLYTHFKVPFDSIQSIDQLIPMLEDRYRTEQIAHARVHQIPLVQSTPQVNNEQETEEIRRLREDLASTNMQLKQLDEANRAWQQYQQNQLVLLRDRLKLTDMENLPFEDIVQQIENRFNELNDQVTELQNVKKIDAAEHQDLDTQLSTNNARQSKDTQTDDNEEHRSQEILIQTVAQKYEEELRQMREDLTALTAQSAQLDEANRAWQLYHQTELDNFRDKLQNSFPIENNLSLDDIAKHMSDHLDQLKNQRENLVQQLQTSEKLNNDLHSKLIKDDPTVQQTHLNTINELTEQLRLLKQQNDQLETEKYILNQQLEKQSYANFNQERNTPTPDSTTSDSKLIRKHTHPAQIHEAHIHNIAPVQSASPPTDEHEQELQQLRENIVLLTNQCAQLDQANQAWQLYQQSQLDNFRKTIQDHLPIDDNASLEQAAQQIADQVTKERNNFTQQYLTLEKVNDELRSESVNNMETIDELNRELLAAKEKHDTISSQLLAKNFDEVALSNSATTNQEEVRQLRENLASLTTQLDETNRAWQLYQQSQTDNFRSKLHNYVPIHENASFDEIAQQIADQVTSEREDFSEKYQAFERANNALRSESNDNMESIRQSYMNTVNQLNQDLLTMKEAYDQLDTERQVLLNELEKRPVGVDQDQVTRAAGKITSNIVQNPFENVPIHTSGANVDQETEEVRQLRENVVALTAQCAQLDEANRAWLQYQQTQTDNFKTKLHDYLPIDDNTSFDEIAQQIIDQVTREREDFSEKYQTLERVNNDLQSRDNIESVQQSYMNTVYDLNQKLLAMKDAYDQLDAEKQVLITELEKRPVEVAQGQVTRTTEKLPSDLWKEPFREVPIHTSSAAAGQQAEELRQLRENIVALTTQCAQLDEANRAWQQYQQAQMDNFRTKLHDYVPVNETDSLDDVAQQIVDHTTREREDFNERYQALEKAYNDLQLRDNTESIRQSYMNTVNELNQELLAVKEAYNELDTQNQSLAEELEKQSAALKAEQVRQTFAPEKVPSDLFKLPFAEVPIHTSGTNVEQDAEELRQLRENVVALTAQCAQLDEANRAWLQYQQAQTDNFKTKLHDYLPIDDNASFDEIAQQIIDEMTREREDFSERYQALERAHNDLQSREDPESIRQSYMNTVNELNQELLAMKEAYNELDTERQVLAKELEKQSAEMRAEQARQTFAPEKTPSDLFKLPLPEVPIHTSGTNAEQDAEELRQLRENIAALTAQCAQLDEANRAWQSYQQAQVNNLQSKLIDYLPIDENASFDEFAQQLVDQIIREREDFNDKFQALEKANDELRSESTNNLEAIKQSYINTVNELNLELNVMKEAYDQLDTEKQGLLSELEKRPIGVDQDQVTRTAERVSSNIWREPFREVPIHTSADDNVEQLRENIAALTAQCAQLDEANRAWQLYQQSQLENFRTKLHDYVAVDGNTSLEDIAQQIVDQMANEREDFTGRYGQLEKVNDNLRSESATDLETIKQSYMNSVNELNQELLAMKEAYDQLDKEKQDLISEVEKRPVGEVPIHTSSADAKQQAEEVQQLRESVENLTAQCAQLNEANRAWQLYQQTQLDNFKTKLHDYVAVDNTSSLDDIAQQLVDHMTNEREDFTGRYGQLEKFNEDLRSESATDLEAIKQSYMNTVNELNQELLAMKEAYDQLDTEKQELLNELEKRPAQVDQNQVTRTTEKVPSDIWREPFREVPIHTSSADAEQQAEEVQQLRESVATLTAQCAQLVEANRAWQLYQQSQLDNFRTKLHDYVAVDETASLDDTAQQIVDQMTKEREDFTGRYSELEKVTDDLRSESATDLETIKQSYINTVNELNLELNVMKEAYDQLDTEKEGLLSELEKRPAQVDQNQVTRTTEKVPSDIWREPFREVPIHTSSADAEQQAEEVQQLRESVATLTAQCAQLVEANRAWQLYQQSQLDNFRTKLHDYVAVDETASLDDIAQQIVDQMANEREDFTGRYGQLEKVNDNLRSESATDLETIKQSYMNSVNELNQELLAMKEAYDQLDKEKQDLISEVEKRPVEEVPIHTSSADAEQQAEEVQQLRESVETLTAQCAQLDEANRAWQQYQQSQLDNFRTKLHDYVAVDENASLNDIAQQIVDQMTKEREDSTGRYGQLEKVNDDFRSESATDLETIKQSYMHTINELNQELLAMKEAYDQLDTEKEALIAELEKRPVNSEFSPINLSDEVPLQTSSANVEPENEELQQLRENFAVLNSRFAQLNEANQAWQGFHQSELDKFRTKVQDCIPLDEDLSFDQIAQQIVDQITKDRDDFAEQYQALEDTNNDLQSESIEANKNFAVLKEQYDEVLREKERLINEIENQERDKQAIESTNSILLEKETEMSQLRENLHTLTDQLKDTNHSWEQFQQTQFDLLKTLLPSSTKTSLEEIIPEIVLYINHLTEEIDLLKENQRNFQQQYEELLEKKSFLSSLNDQTEQDLALLQSQCSQLDNANRAWQTFYDNQIDLLKTKFEDYIQFDDNPNFEQIIQSIVTELDSNENEQLKQQLNDLQETNSLLMNNNQNLTYRLNQLERPSSPFVSKQIDRTSIQEVQIHRLSPVQSASSQNIAEDEEVQQLRTELSALTAQCAQLDEANRAWQQYHQNQLELFRKNLEDWILLDQNSTLEQIGQQIINQLDQLGRHQQKDSNSTNESLNKQLLDVQQECEEFREQNAKLISIQQQIEQQLEEQQQQNDLLQLENEQLQGKLNEMEQRPSQSAFQRVEPSRENVTPHNTDQEDEIQQLRNDLAATSVHCLQLEEAIRAWQKYQHDQIESFRQNLQEQIPSLNQIENPSLDSISQQIIDYLNQLNNQKDNLIQQNDSLRDEIQVQKKESVERPSSADGGTRMFREAQIQNIAPVQSASPLTDEHEQELQQLRENIVLLTNQCAQLDQANQAWQLYQQSQMDNFRKTIQDHLPVDDNASLEQAAQQIADQVTKERDNFTQQYLTLEKVNDELRSELVNNMETIDELNQELLAAKEEHDTTSSQLLAQNFDEVPSSNGAMADQEEVRQLRENLASLIAQLDETNRAWQSYQQMQADNFRSKLHDYVTIDENASLDEIAQQIADQVTSEREEFSEQYQALERAHNDLRSGHDVESIGQSYMNTVNELNQELNAMKEAYDQLDKEKQHLLNELEKRPVGIDQDQVTHTAEKVSSNIWKEPFREVPIHTSGDDNVEQLRENIAALTAQCAQLDEANRAWQLYQQSQLDNFRTKLHDYVAVDETASLDDVAQQIVDQMTKEREDFTGRYSELEKVTDDLRSELASHMEPTDQPSIETVDELTEQLLNLRNQYEELEKINKQLLLEKENLNNQLNDRSIVVGHHSAFESNFDQNETPAESKQESELQASPIPTETEEIRQIRSDLALITSQFTELTQTNENELNSFRNKLQNWISLFPNSTLDEIAQQLNSQFEQQQQQIPPETAEIETQTIEPSEKIHVAIETTPLAYENHHTQIDPIDTIDQQIQTETLLHIWLTSNDENILNSNDDDDGLRNYVDEIISLSPLDLSYRLNKECEQILSKQNFEKPSHQNLELNHLALITIYSLYHQHLTDDAKQLYNDTVIGALKQEYELINNEKTDYMEKYLYEVDTKEKQLHKLQNEYDDLLEQNELERLDSKQSFDDLTEKYELKLFNLQQENEKLKYNLNKLEDNQRQNKEQNYEQLENEYQQLREDYNELINQNELLKDYNSEMYQRKLQDSDPNSHDIEIQCNLSEENRVSSWNNDWDEEDTNPDVPIQEQGSEKSSNEDEINRLKAMIEEIQLENQYLKELNSQNALTSAIHQPVYIDNSVQTESENEQPSSSVDILPQTEDNDWNAQFSPLEIPSNEPNLSSVVKQTIDNETQTEEQSQDKLTQVNNKLKRALQTIKDKIHQAVIDRPELFPDIGDDTIERLDHLILAIGNQAVHIDTLNDEYENLLERNQQLEKDIQSNIERISNENSTQTDFKQEEEQITKINDDEEPTLTNRLLNFVSNVTSISRTNEMIDNETQTDEQSQDKLVQVNNKLKRVLQNIKDKIHQAVIEQPELFPDVGDDTIERLDYFISKIGNQARQIDRLENECDQAQHEIEQLQSSLEAAQYQIDNERLIKTEQLVSAAPPSEDISQSTIEDYEKQIQQLQQTLSQNEDERSLLRERLNEVELEFRNTFDDRESTTTMYEEQLQSLIQERNALVEQQAVQSAESQHEIERLQEELANLKQTPVTSNEDVQSLQIVIQEQAEEMKDLSEKYFDLLSRFDAQDEIDKQKRETDERLANYENQIEHLLREHTNLLDQVQQKSSLSMQTIDNESQTEDQQHDEVAQVNSKLKRVLKGYKEKLHRIATERPDLFVNVRDETSERLDHLISTVEHQSAQIGILQAEHDQSEEQLRNEIQDLQSSLEACQYQLANEHPIRTEQLATAAPSSDEISQSTIEDYEKQIKQLQQKLSQNEDERSLLRERLNEVELEFRKTFDDHASTTAMYEEQLQSLVQERNALIEQQAIQSADSQHEVEQLQQQLEDLKQLSTTTPVDLSSNEEIQSLKDELEEKSEELKDLSEKYFTLSSQLNSSVNLQTEFDRLKMETEERLTDYENQIENLTRERAALLEEIQKNALSSVQTTDDHQQQDKLTKLNTKLKRALQTFKEKINRIVTERPDLFVNVGEETNERVEHLISTVEHQAAQINALQTEHSELEEQLRNEIRELQSSAEAYRYQIENERPIRTEQLVTAAPPSEDISQSTIQDYEKQIKQLQQKLSQNEDERSLLRERLNEVELEFRKTFDDLESATTMYEEQLQSLIQERNALVEQQAVQSAENQQEIEQLQEELTQLKQSDKDITSLNEVIEQQSEQLKQLNEQYIAVSSQLRSQAELDRQKEEAEERLTDYENQIENLTRERAALLEEIQKNALSSIQTTDDHQQQDKLTKLNTKLKRALQTFKEKINRIVTERPDLFVNVGEETNERVDHLISTVEHQAAQINALQTEHSELEEQLRNEIRELQSSAEAYRYQIENEHPIRAEQLVSAAPPSEDISQSTIEDYEKQIKQLQQKLSQNEDERSLLRERLNEVELEFRKTFDDHAATTTMYEEQLQSFVQERNALVEQQAIQSAESQQEIEQLQEELTQLKQLDKDINSLNQVIEQQSEQLKQLNEKYIAVSSQVRSQAELDRQKEEAEERLTDYENQIENLTRERAALLEEMQKNALSPVQATDNERQTTDGQQQDKLAKINTKLKRALQIFKEKINRIVTERPDLFVNVGEETNERVDHLISTVEHQAEQINALQTEHSEVEEQLRNEINELQNSFDLYRQQIDNENRLKSLSSPPTLIHQTDTEPTEQENEIQPLQTSNDNQWNDWSMDPPQQTDTTHQGSTAEEETPSVANRLFGFFKNVTAQWTEETPTNDWDDQTSPLHLSSEEPQRTISSPSSIDNLLQLIKNKIQQIISEYPNLFPNLNEDVLDNLDQLISIIKNQQNQIEELQNKSITDEHQKHLEPSTPSEQRISRRVFEREMLAWSKESDRLKEFVKQIQIENKKLKDIIFKFEPIIRDYMHENERLKQEIQQLSLLSYPSNTEDSTSSDPDICYLTLKWLTYEVAQRTSNNNEQSSIISDDHDIYLRQKLINTEQQLKSIRIQNQKLKKQVETYTIQFKHIQHEINTKNREISALKNEIEKLRTSETQYRLEVDRLKADLQCDQVKFQQLERQLTDLQFERTSIEDTDSTNNLRELLELKERELSALKEKLDYTIQAHQLELQEAIKANQFSLDNVQRFEQLDQRHQEKRRELERRLGKICKIVRPMIDNQYLFREESMIDIDELQQLVTDTEAEEKVINSLGPIRDCLGLLESQMKELQENLLENHARRSKKPKYKPSENQWEITSQPEVSETSDLFSNSSSTDSIENDVRLCLDDILYDIIVRTTVK